MKILELVVELHGNKEVSINGIPINKGGMLHHLEEKIFLRQVAPDQQWRILCELRQLLARAEHAYTSGRVLRGEITEGDALAIRSGAEGVPNTGIGRLRNG
jgi:hypothetical protein